MSADRFSHPPLDAIAGYRSAQDFSHRQPNTRPADHLTLHEKHRHAGRKVPPALLINALEVGMLQKPRRLGKCSGSLMLGTAVHVDFRGVGCPILSRRLRKGGNSESTRGSRA